MLRYHKYFNLKNPQTVATLAPVILYLGWGSYTFLFPRIFGYHLEICGNWGAF